MLKDVGVIVITILIALALEQMAKSRRWSRETGEAHAPQTVALDRNPSRLE